ncbi:MAG: hypothetical protein A2Z40_01555 [Deltaproteobacteria bacterium RBG_19FT_COMBO_60_16]|nr:MAG: hypothetical protein A2Z40_01555 [Deltaproteobacteria bacterium RBG_19FT_COMBO_60_16]
MGVYTEKIHLSDIAAHFDRKVVYDITEYDVIAFRNVRQDTPTRNGGRRTPAAVNREMSVLKRLPCGSHDYAESLPLFRFKISHAHTNTSSLISKQFLP